MGNDGKELEFGCTSCGSCCRRVTQPLIDNLRSMGYDFPYNANKKTGICEQFDVDTKMCRVYENRPELCIVAYDKDKHKGGAKKYFMQEAKQCNQFMIEDGISPEFYINVNQYR